jgi:rubredoxin
MPKGAEIDADVVGEGDIAYGEEDFDAASPKSKGGASASASSSAKPSSLALRKTGAFLLPGVTLPESALHPSSRAVASSAPKTSRTRETLIINRTVRGKEALQPREYACSRAKDFSAFHPEEEPTYDKGYLNELCYADATKQRGKERRKKEIERERKEAAEQKRQYMLGGRKGKGPDFGGEGGGGGDDAGGEAANSAASLAAFFDRQMAIERRRDEARVESQQSYLYETNPDKKVCPVCHATQSFAEWKGNVKRCPRESCQGAHYRAKLLWSEVQSSFLGRWTEFNVKREANLKELAKEVEPPFRVTSRKVFNKQTGEMEDQAIPEQSWEAVADSFLTRQDEVVERVKAAAEAARKERDRVEAKQAPKLNKPYKFSKPLPDFFTRQAQANERTKLSFEERLEMMGAK